MFGHGQYLQFNICSEIFEMLQLLRSSTLFYIVTLKTNALEIICELATNATFLILQQKFRFTVSLLLLCHYCYSMLSY